ncbi:hypothetical protein BO70DRAFT_353435 [Aspergillus heteromorphus CBS 117.55]|uniref:Uncharacterized protein n=1 Tax=Aspergillus heteromorphus CBS 117.55 TaxID=1448321 RepID=A0A317VZE9_9EURO|nr:uncharacterized protein BO70DRAFT_353435 [Aspergillus heteromorphus CBS 117.55]PWY79724.1 hypothetical protein BO70DRAFT_353435 [Aspergillus heteromorphus CBS 117.55]
MDAVDLLNPPHIPTDRAESRFCAKLWDCTTETRIQSGQIIALTTPDPEALPLPSFELLRVHWTINRLYVISGAAGGWNEKDDDGTLYDGSSENELFGDHHDYDGEFSSEEDIDTAFEVVETPITLGPRQRYQYCW